MKQQHRKISEQSTAVEPSLTNVFLVNPETLDIGFHMVHLGRETLKPVVLKTCCVFQPLKNGFSFQ